MLSINQKIKYPVYKGLRNLKTFFILIYTTIVFFEKPYYCYDKHTFNFLKEKPYENEDRCNDNVAFMNLPIIPNFIFRMIELFLLVCFILIQRVFAVERKALDTYTKAYHYLQFILTSMIILSIVEIIFSLIIGIYPLLTFILRAFIIICLVRNLRSAWLRIFQILWKTKTVFFLLFCNIFIFGLTGRFLFGPKLYSTDEHEDVNPDFATISDAFYSLYILLSTCNFPDVMLGTFKKSKLSVFFFAFYIAINIFIILSLLKALYYSNYFEIFKDQAEELIKNIKNHTMNTQIFKKQKVHLFLINLYKKFSFTEDEYNKILHIVNLKNEKIFKETFKVYQKREENLKKNKMFKFFNQKRVELIINIIDLVLIYFLFKKTADNNITIFFQIIWCSLFIFEFLIYLHYLGLGRLMLTQLLRCIFYVVNFLLFVCLITFVIYYYILKKYEECNILFEYSKPLIVLRAIRIFVFVNLFPEFKIIFSTLHNMKSIFSGHLLNLFSFFFIFSTMSMLMTGGTIRKDSFFEHTNIPNNYYHINFNDFGSSFLTCFALMMINNVNIIAKSLSIGFVSYQKFFNSYFATFYFFSTLIIINICQTLLLEMYLSIKAKKL